MNALTRVTTFDVPAVPEVVFPLLCPVREHDWIAGWSCEVIHSESGMAEEDCVFLTSFADAGPMTWVVSRYHPPRVIEFTCFVHGAYVMRLKIVLAAEGDSTRLEWTRRWLSLGPKGDAWLAAWSEAGYRKRMDDVGDSLRHYLATGHILGS